MTDILVDWSDGSVARSLRFKGKLREVGEDLTSRVILGAEHWLADKVDVARNITISHSNNIYKRSRRRQVEANPTCVERLLCESFRRTEQMSGLPYLLFTFAKYDPHKNFVSSFFKE